MNNYQNHMMRSLVITCGEYACKGNAFYCRSANSTVEIKCFLFVVILYLIFETVFLHYKKLGI